MPTSNIALRGATGPLLRCVALREPLALLRWHDGQFRAPLQAARRWVHDASERELADWLSGRHLVLVPSAGGRRCRLHTGGGTVRLVDHPGYGEAERVAEVLAPPAERPTCRSAADVLALREPCRLWPWDGADRRERRGAVDPHLAAVAVGRLALAWRTEPVDPGLAWACIRQGLAPQQARGWVESGIPAVELSGWLRVTAIPARAARRRRSTNTARLLGPAPAERPPYLGLGYPCGPWLNTIAEQVRDSGRRRRACAVCWQYGVSELGADLCAPCRVLLRPAPEDAGRATHCCAGYSAHLAHGPGGVW